MGSSFDDLLAFRRRFVRRRAFSSESAGNRSYRIDFSGRIRRRISTWHRRRPTAETLPYHNASGHQPAAHASAIVKALGIQNDVRLPSTPITDDGRFAEVGLLSAHSGGTIKEIVVCAISLPADQRHTAWMLVFLSPPFGRIAALGRVHENHKNAGQPVIPQHPRSLASHTPVPSARLGRTFLSYLRRLLVATCRDPACRQPVLRPATSVFLSSSEDGQVVALVPPRRAIHTPADDRTVWD